MNYNLRKNWVSAFDLLKAKPIILLPFIITAFFECLAVELIYFSSRKPLSIIAGPVIRKFYGEASLHYPGNVIILPNIFYYLQILIYIFIAVFLTGVSINIFRNVKEGLPLRTNAFIKNALKRCGAFLSFGILMIILLFLLKKADLFIFNKLARLAAKQAPRFVGRAYFSGASLFLFASNIILQTFFILALPIMVMQKSPLVKALGKSISLGFRRFFSLFALILVPSLLFLPIALLKSNATQLAQMTFPEITVAITLLGIVLTIFIDSFVIVCASQFLLDTEE
ncbi:MAG: hypothetical protein V2A72_01705 [Candidatus Omnitrophota bacterium]